MISLLTYTAIFSFLVLLYIYVGYPIFLGILSTLFPAKKIRKDKICPDVSLIISCYNEEDILKEKLANSLAIDYPKEKLEIIVVSDASSDRTDEIAREHADQGVRLIRQDDRLGKTMGLNLAVPKARGEIIVFSDANAMYQPDAIINLVENFADETIGYVVGEAKYVDVDSSAAAKSEDTYWQYEIFIKKMESRLHSIVGGDGAIYAIRSQLYEKMEQTDINDFVNPLQIIAKGFRGIYEPNAICLERAAGSFEKEFGRKARIVNRSFNGLLRVKSVTNPFKAGIFSWEIISHKLLRWFAPVPLFCFCLSSIIVGFCGELIFQYISGLILLFILMAFVGHLQSVKAKINPVFYIPYYFSLVNLASAIGVYRRLTGKVQATWNPPRVKKSILKNGRKGTPLLQTTLVVVLLLLAFGIYLERHTGIEHFLAQMIFWLSLTTIAYTYFGYPLVLAVWAKLFTLPIQKGEIFPTVALLVCAYNEEEVIEEKVLNSLALDYPHDKLKTVIASDGSSDRTNSIVRKYQNDQLTLLDYKTRQGKIGVINATVPKLDAEIIVFSDANTMYSPDAIKKLIRNFNDSAVGGVSADVILQNDETSFGESESVYYRYERWIQQNESNIGSIIGADGGMYAIRRELFVASSPNTILDDFVIAMNVAKSGHRVVYESEAVSYEKSTISHKGEFIRKSRVIAGAIQSVKQREGVPAGYQAGLLFCYLSHKYFRWMVPVLLVVVFLASCYLAAFSQSRIYIFCLAIQTFLYFLAASGYVLKHHVKIFMLSIPFYFCLENGAALYGIYKGLLNRQAVKWRKLERVRTVKDG